MTWAVAAFDVGGTVTKAGLFTRLGPLGFARTPTGATDGPREVVERLRDVALRLLERARSARCDLIAAVVAAPGIIDEDRGIACASLNLNWSDVPIAEMMSARLGCPVLLRRDVRSAAYAESAFGAAAGRRSALVVSIGTGIGAAVVGDGQRAVGAGLLAGEIGQLLVEDSREGCAASLESIASARAIAERYCRATGMAHKTIRTEDVARRTATDPVAAEIWDEAIAGIAEALASAVALIDPMCIVVGGGLSRAGGRLLTPLGNELQSQLPWRIRPELLTARFVDDGAWVGAALEAWEYVGRPNADDVGQFFAGSHWMRLAENSTP